jgi:ATP-dependent helicase/nuclease subunit A
MIRLPIFVMDFSLWHHLARRIFQMNDSFPATLIKASAGTGKTFELSGRFIALLIAGESADNILATTFTKKAAGEIRERVFQRLAEAAISEKGAAKLAGELKRTISTPRSQEILKEMVLKQHRLNITTLDAFFHKIASSFALELGLTPTWTLRDAAADNAFYESVITNLCGSGHLQELTALLKNEFNNISSVFTNITTAARNLYDIFRQTEREAWHWIETEEELTEKELSVVYKKLSQVELPKTAKGTEDQRWRKAIDKTIESIQRKDWRNVIDAGIGGKILTEEPFYGTPIPDEIVTAYEPLLRHIKAVTLNKLKQKNESTYKLLTLFNEEYEKLHALTDSLNFDDVKYKLLHAKFRTDLDHIYYRLDSRIRHLLLDEFQDTSFPQWGIIEPIADEILSQSGEERSFFCVGDVKQAIYGWRGGVSAIFDTLEEKWEVLKQPESRHKSRRCSQPILDVVNKVFEALQQVPEITTPKYPERLEATKKWRKGFEGHTSAVNNNEGFVSFQILPEDSDESLIYETAVNLALEIKQRRPDFKIALLTRTNQSVAKIINHFTQRQSEGGPIASEEGGNPLTDSPAVRACLALLHLIDHPHDTQAAFHVAESPLGKVLNFTDWRSAKVEELCKNLRRKISQHGFGHFFIDLIENLKGFCCERDLKRLTQLAEIGLTFPEWSNPRLEEFADFVREQRVEDASSADIRVMTIHASKGLEFDAVILPELNANLFGKRDPVLTFSPKPSEPPTRVSHSVRGSETYLDPRLKEMRRYNNDILLQEALSVLYVAMTRAKSELYMLSEYLPDRSSGDSLSYALILKRTLLDSGCDEYQHGKQLETLSDHKKPAPLSQLQKVASVTIPQHRRVPRLRRRSPSELEGGDKTLLSDLFSSNRYAAELGTITHALFELVNWIDEGLPTRSELLEKAHLLTQKTGDEGVITEAIEIFEKALSKPNIVDIFQKNRYQVEGSHLELFKEQRFSIYDKNIVIAGAFDRLVAVSVGNKVVKAEIIDFKTDRILENSPEALQKKIDFYRPQLLAYQRAAAKFLSLEVQDISLSLAFVRSGDVVAI